MPGKHFRVLLYDYISLSYQLFYSLSLHLITFSCRLSFQGNCLDDKDPTQRPTAKCGMHNVIVLSTVIELFKRNNR